MGLTARLRHWLWLLCQSRSGQCLRQAPGAGIERRAPTARRQAVDG